MKQSIIDFIIGERIVVDTPVISLEGNRLTIAVVDSGLKESFKKEKITPTYYDEAGEKFVLQTEFLCVQGNEVVLVVTDCMNLSLQELPEVKDIPFSEEELEVLGDNSVPELPNEVKPKKKKSE